MRLFGGGEKDPKWVVQDEVSGLLLGAIILNNLPITEQSHLAAAILFVFFRAFDIWKPFPASYFDKSDKVNAIIHDDLVAGIYAAIVSYFVLRLFP